jgi:hypothetical protein
MTALTPRMPRLRLWRMTRARYEGLVEKGAFGPDDRVALLDGLLVVREPQGSRHAVVVGLVRAALARGFGEGYHVREEKPFALDDTSELEPDLAIVGGRLRDFWTVTPPQRCGSSRWPTAPSPRIACARAAWTRGGASVTTGS